MCRSRTPRVARGAVVASVATFTALLSHVVAGGAVPGPLGILAPWLLALMASTLLAGRTLSLVRLGASVLVSQALFHTLFVMGAATPAATMPAMSHHDHGAMSMAMDAAGTARTSGFLLTFASISGLRDPDYRPITDAMTLLVTTMLDALSWPATDGEESP
ncbi:hypothetical protein [Microbacterium lacticum]